MHEYSIVESLVGQLTAQLQSENKGTVRAIRLRLGSTLAEGPIRQAFTMLSKGTALEHATLTIDRFDVQHTCPGCQSVFTVKHEDLLGHMFICPDCHMAAEVDEAHGLTVMDMS